MAKMRMTWDSPNDAKLLRGILKYAKLGKKGYQELADHMGNGCTAMAIQKRIQKLQGAGAKDASESSPRLTPNQSALTGRTTINEAFDGAARSSTPEPKKRKMVVQDHSEDEDQTFDSPTKRLKLGKMGQIKLEPTNETVEHYV
ncbi:hypothetical protein RJZ56_005204 [Blastomyces dermatitidis]|uniref:Myb-like domain-containing protein n=2 Tax=Ajellomyces dermatitidis (strain ER-3 / ATCC MYA-2586) TaxID=559297 RepID=A0ABX2VWS9_AJEDR|nr:uncharacterized protein BDCG_05646 [Blastomyces dermatitidis ER-3]OAT01616.1 hypothetical protein BDCG_05646 [Blastomyces dermatitidis ER-3]